MYDHVWRKYANIPESKRLVAGITIGYPDPGVPVNAMITPREPVDKTTTWLGY
jgi:nitroreductase